jgi:hypothetical protein
VKPLYQGFKIASSGYEVEQVWLELAKDTHQPQARRVFIPKGKEIGDILGETLLHFLYNRAFKNVVAVSLPYHTLLLDQAEREQYPYRLPLLEQIGTYLGLKKRWHSDATTLCMTSDDNEILLCAQQQPYPNWQLRHLTLRLGVKNRKALNDYLPYLRKHADLS